MLSHSGVSVGLSWVLPSQGCHRQPEWILHLDLRAKVGSSSSTLMEGPRENRNFFPLSHFSI